MIYLSPMGSMLRVPWLTPIIHHTSLHYIMQVVMKVRSQTWSWPLTLATVQNTPGLPSYVININTSSTARLVLLIQILIGATEDSLKMKQYCILSSNKEQSMKQVLLLLKCNWCNLDKPPKQQATYAVVQYVVVINEVIHMLPQGKYNDLCLP